MTTGTWTYATHMCDGTIGSGTVASTQATSDAITARTISERQRPSIKVPTAADDHDSASASLALVLSYLQQDNILNDRTPQTADRRPSIQDSLAIRFHTGYCMH